MRVPDLQWEHIASRWHVTARQSTGSFPAGLGLRVFYWGNSARSSVSLDLLFLFWDLQIGWHPRPWTELP